METPPSDLVSIFNQFYYSPSTDELWLYGGAQGVTQYTQVGRMEKIQAALDAIEQAGTAAILNEVNARIAGDDSEASIRQLSDADLQSQLDTLESALGSAMSGYRGKLSISDTPTQDGFYLANQSGIYTNAGNLPVNLSQGITLIDKLGASYSSIVIPLDLANYYTKSEIDGVLTSYYTKAQADDKIQDAVTITQSEEIILGETTPVLGNVSTLNVTRIPLSSLSKAATLHKLTATFSQTGKFFIKRLTKNPSANQFTSVGTDVEIQVPTIGTNVFDNLSIAFQAGEYIAFYAPSSGGAIVTCTSSTGNSFTYTGNLSGTNITVSPTTTRIEFKAEFTHIESQVSLKSVVQTIDASLNKNILKGATDSLSTYTTVIAGTGYVTRSRLSTSTKEESGVIDTINLRCVQLGKIDFRVWTKLPDGGYMPKGATFTLNMSTLGNLTFTAPTDFPLQQFSADDYLMYSWNATDNTYGRIGVKTVAERDIAYLNQVFGDTSLAFQTATTLSGYSFNVKQVTITETIKNGGLSMDISKQPINRFNPNSIRNRSALGGAGGIALDTRINSSTGALDTLTGYKTYIFQGKAGETFTIGGILGLASTLRTAFYNTSLGYVPQSYVAQTHPNGAPHTITFPQDGYYGIVLSGPSDTGNIYDNAYINEGLEKQDYVAFTAPELGVSKINGNDIVASGLTEDNYTPFPVNGYNAATKDFVEQYTANFESNSASSVNYVNKVQRNILDSIVYKRLIDGPLPINLWVQGNMTSFNMGSYERVLIGYTSANAHNSGQGDSSTQQTFTRYTDNNGQTWSPLKVIKPNPGTNTNGTTCDSIGYDSTGKLWAVVRNKGNTQFIRTDPSTNGQTWMELFTSTDHGNSWTSLGNISYNPDVTTTFANKVCSIHDMEEVGSNMVCGIMNPDGSSIMGFLKISKANPSVREKVIVYPFNGVDNATHDFNEPTITNDTVNNKVIGGIRSEETIGQLYFMNPDCSGFTMFPCNSTIKRSPIPVKIVRDAINGDMVVYMLVERMYTGVVEIYTLPLADFYNQDISRAVKTVIGNVISEPILSSPNVGVPDMVVANGLVHIGFSVQRDGEEHATSIYYANFDPVNPPAYLSYKKAVNMTAI